VLNQGAAGQRVQHFGLDRLHPGALASRENDDVQVPGH
jgi:hypothetical protein